MDMSIRFPNLQIYFGYVGRSFSVFGFEVTIYGLLIAVGMLLGLCYVLRQAKRRNEDQNLYLEMMIPAVLGGLLGGRFLYVALNWELFSGQSLSGIWNIRNGGMSLFGGILGGALFSALYCRIRRISFQRMADTASMGFLITQIIGVWGNFFNRESFGGYTDSLFAMQIPLDAVSGSQLTDAVKDHLVTVEGVSFIQVHPLFLYESAWCLLLFLILLVYTRRKTYQGEIFLRYLAGYSLGRIGIEWLRTDALKIPGTDIPVFLPVCAILFIVCGSCASVRRFLSKKRAARSMRRREEQYASEENTEDSYDNAEIFKTMEDESRSTDSTAETAEASGSGESDMGFSGDPSETDEIQDGDADEVTGNHDNSREDGREISENPPETSEDGEHSPSDTKDAVVEQPEKQEAVPEDGKDTPETEPGGREKESGQMSEDQPQA